MTQGMTAGVKKRIEWIDIAKAIAIVLMIAGHTFPYGAYARNVIFSFHMPLFLILSGYTFHFADSWKTIQKKEKADFRQLILPVFLVLLIGIIYSLCRNGYSPENLKNLLINDIYELIWASGISVHGFPPLGATWFLISLFWARLILRIFGMKLPHEYAVLTGLGCGAVALLVGNHVELPQNLDVVCMVIMFMTIGILAKENQDKIRQYKIPLFLIALLIWTVCINRGIYIELASRSYPLGLISVIEAVCGGYICCVFAKVCTFFSHRKFLNLLGRNTLTLLEIHCVDAIWAPLFNGSSSVWITCFRRVIADLAIFLIVMFIKSRITQLVQNKKAA